MEDQDSFSEAVHIYKTSTFDKSDLNKETNNTPSMNNAPSSLSKYLYDTCIIGPVFLAIIFIIATTIPTMMKILIILLLLFALLFYISKIKKYDIVANIRSMLSLDKKKMSVEQSLPYETDSSVREHT